jgi:MYXO-CTERM domain-containing protein
VYATSPATKAPGWQDVSGPLSGADTNALAYDGATLWAASAEGLFRTTLPSMAWTLASGAPVDIAAAAAVRGSRLYVGAPRGLFFTDVATADTWLAVLGPSSVQALFVDPSTSALYAGATGIVYQVDASNVATPVGQGLPPVPVTALALESSRLFAGTNGRGVYALDLPATLPDGGAPWADAGVADAALPLDGAASTDADACGCPGTRLRSGCSCQVGASSIPGPSAFALSLLLLASRRRRRQRVGS